MSLGALNTYFPSEYSKHYANVVKICNKPYSSSFNVPPIFYDWLKLVLKFRSYWITNRNNEYNPEPTQLRVAISSERIKTKIINHNK